MDTLNEEVLSKLRLAKTIEHPGESGIAREHVLADFFRKLLPESFGIGTGFVIDATGGKSRQIDLIIYRKDYHPVFEIGGVRHFMVESVIVVMENKASLASTDALLKGLENIKSVKMLDRTNRGKNYTIIGSDKSINVNPDLFYHQIFGAILTEDSLSIHSLRDELLGFLRSSPRKHWPNFYADVRNMAAYYLDSGNPHGVTYDPNKAKYLFISDRQSEIFIPPLIELACELVNFLRVAPLVDF
ncbi:MAG: hypothetical protein HYU02_00365 [Thaumarchaeota archaeon]|nr:hypothetical protein [Nitrososphaerota archaeon]